MASDLEFRRVAADEGDGAVSFAAMVDEIRELYWDIGAGLNLNSLDMPKARLTELGTAHGCSSSVAEQAWSCVAAGSSGCHTAKRPGY